MTVNLVLVDQWAKEFLLPARSKDWSNFADFFEHAFSELQKKAQTEKAAVVRLELLDDEGVQWIYEPSTQKMFWLQKVALNIGKETFWLQMKADHRTALNQVDHFRHEQWKDKADLQKHFSMLEEASLISHGTGVELRLK